MPIMQAAELTTQGPDRRPSAARPARATTLRAREGGGIDADDLEQNVTPPFMADWMRRRFNGRDPYWSISERDMETPDQVFIDLWKAAAPRSNVRHAIDKACAALLEEAWAAEPAEWHRWLLYLVRVITPEPCQPILLQFVLRFAARTPGRHAASAAELAPDDYWLEAAASYRWTAPEAVAAWRQLLRDEDHRIDAFQALAHDPELAIWYLPELYNGVPADLRRFVIRQAVKLILRRAGAD